MSHHLQIFTVNNHHGGGGQTRITYNTAKGCVVRREGFLNGQRHGSVYHFDPETRKAYLECVYVRGARYSLEDIEKMTHNILGYLAKHNAAEASS